MRRLLGAMFLFSVMALVDTAQAEPQKEVLPQQREEVSEVYKSCLSQEHATMLQCIQKKVQQLEEDVKILVDVPKGGHVSDWQAPQEDVNRKNAVEPTEENLKRGQEIFTYYCSMCHGADAKGLSLSPDYSKKTPDLTSPRILSKTDGEIFWKITQGGWPMPAFWEGDMLGEDDFWKLIRYIRSISYQPAEKI